MTWKKLKVFEEEDIWPGTVFRFPAKYPFERQVDFMIFTDPSSASGFSLVCTTGYKAGNLEGRLPKEALSSSDKVRAISRNWLVENWQKWVYPETPVSEVYIIAKYPEKVGG